MLKRLILPMLDLALQLLIFFVIVSAVISTNPAAPQERGASLEIPISNASDSIWVDALIQINQQKGYILRDRSGNISINGSADLRTRLQSYSQGTIVAIRANGSLPLEEVLEVYEYCQKRHFVTYIGSERNQWRRR